MNAFRTLRLNQLPKQARGTGLISSQALAKCEGRVDIEMFRECDAVCLGVDFAMADDMAAITAVGRMGDQYIAAAWAWMTRESFSRCRSKVSAFDRIAGKTLTVVDAEIVDGSLVADEVISIADAVGARDVAIDPAMAGLIASTLTESQTGIVVHWARQGMMNMAPAIAQLQSLMVREKITIANDGLLRMCAENAKILSSSIGMRVTKIGEGAEHGHNPRKIDALSALLNAMQWHIAIGESSAASSEDTAEYVDAWTEPARAANVKFHGLNSDGDTVDMDNRGRTLGHPIGSTDSLGAFILSPCDERQVEYRP